MEEIIGDYPLPETRELKAPNGLTSEQFKTGQIFNLPPRSSPGSLPQNGLARKDPTVGDARLLEGIHFMSKNDDVAAKGARKKRLRFADINKKRADAIRGKDVSRILFETLLKAIPNLGKKKFTWDAYDAKALKNEQNRFDSKPAGIVMNARERAQPDFGAGYSNKPFNFIDISYKSEMKCKMETMGKEAKVLQTLMTMPDSVYHEFNPFIQVLTDCFLDVLPPEMMVNIGKSPKDLNDWAKKFWRHKKGRAIDYTAFDQGQNAVIAEALFLLYEHLGAPPKLLERFKSWKYNLRSRYGEHDVQRFTGESETIFGNTVCGIMLALAAFDLSGPTGLKWPCCFCGDDGLWPAEVPRRPGFEQIAKVISIQIKEEEQSTPNFVGWRLTKEGIFKDPILLWYKHRARVELRMAHLSLISYFHEFALAYRLPNLQDHLTELESKCHSALWRDFARNKSLIAHYGHLLDDECDIMPAMEEYSMAKSNFGENLEKRWIRQTDDSSQRHGIVKYLRALASPWTHEIVKGAANGKLYMPDAAVRTLVSNNLAAT